MSKKPTPIQKARQAYEERLKNSGLTQVTVRVWTEPADADYARQAMQEAAEIFKQDTKNL